jgi:hypothetical protein
MRRRWTFIAIALIGGGVVGVSAERAHHAACSAGLGSFGSLTGEAARNCGTGNLLFLVAIAATIVGLALLAASLLIRS